MTQAKRDIWGGLIMVVVGASFAVYALMNLPLGTLARMGPGLYPFAAGVLLLVCGGAITLRGWLSGVSEGEDIDLRAAAWIMASIATFGLLVRPLGLVAALLSLVLVASRADPSMAFWKASILALCIAAAAVLIFIVGLGLQFPVIVWPPDF
ncbi:MAG: tripartite tricarboxylate transporter TctB family protein [Paracoccaceae bacterium]